MIWTFVSNWNPPTKCYFLNRVPHMWDIPFWKGRRFFPLVADSNFLNVTASWMTEININIFSKTSQIITVPPLLFTVSLEGVNVLFHSIPSYSWGVLVRLRYSGDLSLM